MQQRQSRSAGSSLFRENSGSSLDWTRQGADKGLVWHASRARNSNIWPLIMVSNKASLQNQLQNPRASDPEESNEIFDRAIRKWLL